MDLDALFAEDMARLQQTFYYPGPVQPIRIENGIPFYTSQQINIYGLPHHFGIDQYQIIELEEDGRPPVTDYDMEQERRGSLRPIHHYNRVERFEQILYQLVGCRGVVPRLIIQHIRSIGYDRNPDKVWDSVRSILKKNNWSQYYNRIPIILDQLGFDRKIDFGDNNAFVLNLVNEFRKISAKFEELKPHLVRCYFPNLRYVAFKLLVEYGAVFQYKIPFLRTPRKEKQMDELWELLRS
jgi:hypothetical protein